MALYALSLLSLSNLPTIKYPPMRVIGLSKTSTDFPHRNITYDKQYFLKTLAGSFKYLFAPVFVHIIFADMESVRDPRASVASLMILEIFGLLRERRDSLKIIIFQNAYPFRHEIFDAV